MVHEEIAHLSHVLDIHKIAGLAAVGVIGSMRPEQLHGVCRLHLIEGVEDHTCHAAFVVFVGPEDIEKLQPRPEVGRVAFCGMVQCPAIEVVLGFAVGIQWGKGLYDAVVICVSVLAAAVRGCGRSIDQGQPVFDAGVPNALAVRDVQIVKY